MTTRRYSRWAGSRHMTDRRTYFAALEQLPRVLLTYLLDLEGIQNDFQPARLGEYADYLAHTHVAPLAREATALQSLAPPEDMAEFHAMLSRGLEAAANSARLFVEFAESFDIAKALKSFGQVGEMFRYLYPLRRVVPGLRRYWLLPEAFDAVDTYDPPPRGESDAALGAVLVPHSERHHWFARYVPEWYDPGQAWPVVVALHGGWGRGDHFLWSWVRPAKSRGYIVLSPKSFDTTWTEADLPSVLAMLEATAEQFAVDRDRVLLTGLSDGGIFTYLFGLNHPDPFAALATIAANFAPFMVPDDKLRLPVRITHGDADHMFPAQVARGAAWLLQERGYPVAYHERAGYGHFYPPAENVAILDWFEARVGPGPRPREAAPAA